MNWWLWILVGIIVAAGLGQRFGSGKGIRLDQIKMTEDIMAPGFKDGGTWLNSKPLTMEELLADERVKAVLVDFWTYSCINCQRTIPYLKSWWEKYKDKGLVIVGVHSPEFEFEKETHNVEMAMVKYGVGWPVVQDNEMAIWRAYKNNYWPHKYLVNKAGKIVYDHIGEGAYEETERQLQEVLGVSGMGVTEEPVEGGIGLGMKQTPELYVNQRGQLSGHLGKGMDKVELIGDWEIQEDLAQAGAGAKLKLEYQAGEMNLVMSGTGKVTYSIDGEEKETIEVTMADLYNLWKGEFGKHIVEIEFDAGVRVHAFTFGR